MEYAVEVNPHSYAPLKHFPNQIFHRGTQCFKFEVFFFLPALKEGWFAILDGLCMSLGAYRKIYVWFFPHLLM